MYLSDHTVNKEAFVQEVKNIFAIDITDKVNNSSISFESEDNVKVRIFFVNLSNIDESIKNLLNLLDEE